MKEKGSFCLSHMVRDTVPDLNQILTLVKVADQEFQPSSCHVYHTGKDGGNTCGPTPG